MEQHEIDEINRLISLQLESAIKVSEEKMMLAATSLSDEIRKEVRKDHSENRERFERSYNVSAKAVAQNEFIIEKQRDTSEAVVRMENLVRGLVGTVGEIKGRDDANKEHLVAETEKKKKNYEIIKWLGGIIPLTAISKIVYDFFHHKG